MMAVRTGISIAAACPHDSDFQPMPYTNPKTPAQWLRYLIFAAVALGLVYVMLRVYVL